MLAENSSMGKSPGTDLLNQAFIWLAKGTSPQDMSLAALSAVCAGLSITFFNGMSGDLQIIFSAIFGFLAILPIILLTFKVCKAPLSDRGSSDGGAAFGAPATTNQLDVDRTAPADSDLAGSQRREQPVER